MNWIAFLLVLGLLIAMAASFVAIAAGAWETYYYLAPQVALVILWTVGRWVVGTEQRRG
jgi:hypothetical protein